MVSLEFFNNLNPTIASMFKMDVTDVFIHELSVLLINVVSYLYILLKFYKVLCYSRMTFDWMPMINPYIWPFSFFQLMTGPYFAFWSKILPNLKLEKSSIEISGIVGLEALNALIYFCVRFTNMLIVLLEEKEKIN
jgi:uncharacterized protein YggT (Ycf19 family)